MIRLEQTLHGYSEGHRLIAGSKKLSQQDARTMLVLSDASGSSARIPADGYLTGYPLLGSGRYVLARTWSAPEMSRPGCVWTHSLLVDFADLARLVSADDVADLFVRPPNVDATTRFEKTLEVQAAHPSVSVASHELARAASLVQAIYGKPRSRIVAERVGEGDDALVLALWMQQWPRLRRSFRFCTQVSDDRSIGAEVFDLQLIDTRRAGHRARMTNAIFASDVHEGKGIEPILKDLGDPGGSSLRSFLREVGGDVDSGRAAMLPLVRLHAALDPGSYTFEIAEAVSELEALGPSQGRVGRAAIARMVLSRPDVMEKDLVSFALDQVGSAPDLLGVDPGVVGLALLRWRPAAFGSALSAGAPLAMAAEAALSTGEADDLVHALADYPDALMAALPARPDLVTSPSIWKIRSLDAVRLIQAFELEDDHIVAVISSLVTAGRDDVADAAVARWGIGPVIQALADPRHLMMPRAWVRAIARQTDEIAACLADGTLRQRGLLMALCHEMNPDVVPNTMGQDPWVTAAQNGPVSDDVLGEDILAAFLFCRAMGWRTSSPGRLFSLSVQRLHEASAVSRLNPYAQFLADRRLPWVSARRSWDRCERIRRAVVDQFLDRDLPPLFFGAVVDDSSLWLKLVDIAADSSRGRRYLDRVRKELRSGPKNWWHQRADLIDRKVR